MKSPRDKVNFKYRMNEIGKYSTADIDLSNVSQEELEKFSQRVIQRAKELKAKQIALYNDDPENRKEPSYSDLFYLKMAKNIEYEELIGGFKEINKRRIRNYDIKDVQWAQYSYEQIIQMENDGYKIPQEILEWAHAQQQADVTDYIVVSDSTEADDSSSTPAVKSSDEMSVLRAKAVQDIAQIEKTEKETQKTVEQYSEIEKKAKQIQNEKQDKYKESINEINKLTQEWKTLKDKQDNGIELTETEKNRFKELGGLLNGFDGTLTKELKVDSAELDDFLTNLDNLNKKIDKNIKLSNETIQDANDLGNMEKNYHVSNLPWVHSGVIFDGHGLSLNTLYNIRVEEISGIAMKKARDLNQYSESIATDLSNGENIKLTDFAVEYSEMSEKTQQNTKNTMGEDYDKSSNAETTQNSKGQQNNYSVAKAFSFINSIAATATTLNATSDMLKTQDNVEQEEKQLTINLKNAQKNTENLEKESKLAIEKHESNEITAEQFLLQLEETQPQQIKEEPSLNQAPQTQTTTESDPAKTEALENLTKISLEDKKVFNNVQKNINDSTNSTNKSNDIARNLQASNSDLKISKKTAQKVATDTMFVGMGTTVQSFLTRTIGTDLIATGTIMTSSIFPATILAGMKMIASGIALVGVGELEFATGTAATVTGAATLAASSKANNIEKVTDLAGKTAQQSIKTGKDIINQSSKSLGIVSDIQTSENQNTNPENNTIPMPNPEQPEEQHVINNSNAQTNPEKVQKNPENPEKESNLAIEKHKSNEITAEQFLLQLEETQPQQIKEEPYLNQAPQTQTTTESDPAKTEALENLTKISLEDKKVFNNVQKNINDSTNSTNKNDEIATGTTATATEAATLAANSTANEVENVTDLSGKNPKQSIKTGKDIINQSSKSLGTVSDIQTPENQNTNTTEIDENSKDTQEKSEEQGLNYEYSIPNALKAATTTIKATTGVLSSKEKTADRQDSLKLKMKKVEETNNNVEKSKSAANSAQNILVAKINTQKGQLENATLEMQTAEKNGNEAIMLSAQANIQQLNNNIINSLTTGTTINSEFETKVSAANLQLQDVQNEQINLRSDIQDFTNQSDTQLKISKDAIKIGAGTYLAGAGTKLGGMTMFLAGKALFASAGLNIGQAIIGIEMMQNGGVMMDYGVVEQTAGIGAMATGGAGTATNVTVQAAKELFGETQKLGVSFLNLTRGKVRENVNITTEMNNEKNSLIEETNSISAAASSNINSSQSVQTDDKTEIKLLRFNEEVNKEFKKRRRRVMGISATSNGM